MAPSPRLCYPSASSAVAPPGSRTGRTSMLAATSVVPGRRVAPRKISDTLISRPCSSERSSSVSHPNMETEACCGGVGSLWSRSRARSRARSRTAAALSRPACVAIRSRYRHKASNAGPARDGVISVMTSPIAENVLASRPPEACVPVSRISPAASKSSKWRYSDAGLRPSSWATAAIDTPSGSGRSGLHGARCTSTCTI